MYFYTFAHKFFFLPLLQSLFHSLCVCRWVVVILILSYIWQTKRTDLNRLDFHQMQILHIENALIIIFRLNVFLLFCQIIGFLGVYEENKAFNNSILKKILWKMSTRNVSVLIQHITQKRTKLILTYPITLL